MAGAEGLARSRPGGQASGPCLRPLACGAVGPLQTRGHLRTRGGHKAAGKPARTVVCTGISAFVTLQVRHGSIFNAG